MTVPWSLTVADRMTIDSTIGAAPDRESAVAAVLAAAYTAIDSARLLAGPAARYELFADAQLVAIIQTGMDEHGRPNHSETAALLRRIAVERELSSLPV